MKSIRLVLLALILSGCATTVTTNTLPDGTKVSVTAKSSDPVAIKAAMDAAILLLPIIESIATKQSATTTTP